MSDRPPAFRLPSPKNEPLFLFFGKGDYVIAKTAVEASCLWMDHFDDLAYAREFEVVPNDEEIDLFIDSDDTSCELWVMTQAEIAHARHVGLSISPTAVGLAEKPEQWLVRDLVERFGKGYLASTTED